MSFMADKFLDHPILSSRYLYPRPNRFEDGEFEERIAGSAPTAYADLFAQNSRSKTQ